MKIYLAQNNVKVPDKFSFREFVKNVSKYFLGVILSKIFAVLEYVDAGFE